MYVCCLRSHQMSEKNDRHQHQFSMLTQLAVAHPIVALVGKETII